MADARKTRQSIKDGEEARRQYQPVWAECDNYFRGEQTLYRDFDSNLVDQTSIPRRRRNIREVHNVVTSRCMREVSAYTALFPGYQVDPSPPVNAQSASVGSQSATAAAVAGERLLSHFRDELNLSDADARVIQMAVVFGEGYMFPFFNSKLGRPLGNSGKFEGRVDKKVLDPSQVVWEAGCRFDESSWFAFECFYTKDEFALRWPEFANKVKSNSIRHDTMQGSLLEDGHGKKTLISVYEYYRRRTPGDAGVKMILCGDEVLSESEYPFDYPEVEGQQWLTRFSYYQPERQSRAMGMMQMLLDPQRGFNRDKNLAAEWKGLTMVPMIEVPRNIIEEQGFRKVEPGKVIIVDPALGGGIRYVTPGSIPPEIANADSVTQSQMDSITGRYDMSNLASSAAAATVQQIIQQGQAAQATISRGFSESRARVGTRFLLIAREQYTETREVKYEAYTGKTTTTMVASKEMPSWANVHVTSGPPRTRSEIAAMANDWGTKGWVAPPAAMLAIESNDLSILTEQYKLDIDKQRRENQSFTHLDPKEINKWIAAAAMTAAGVAMEAQQAEGDFDMTSASPPPGPWPHASKDDNHDLQLDVLSKWFKTDEFSLLPQPIQQVAYWHRDEHMMLKTQAAQRQQMLETAQAEQLGAANASRPPQAKPMPSQAKLPQAQDVVSEPQPA